jgi:membrane protease YdiL (CAAX protease family)
MIGPILLAVSWFLLRLEGRGLDAIGFNAPRKRAVEFTAGFVAFGTVAATQQLGLSLVASDPFMVNADVNARSLLNGLRFTVNSVLYEELVFRGYLLYRAIQWLGSRGAVWLAAGAFGVYHWFSYGVLGNPVPMVYVFLLTGMFGYLWARAFVVTGSVAAPIGLHLGWNAVAYLVFSAGPLGPALLIPTSGAPSLQAQTLTSSLGLSIALPVAATACGLWILRRIERRTAPRASMKGSDVAAT